MDEHIFLWVNDLVETKKKAITVITVCIVAAIAVTIGAFFVIVNGRLSRALDNLNIRNKASVTKVFKYAGDNAEVFIDVARAYLDDGKARETAAVLWHVLQNIDSENVEARAMLKEYYGDSPLSAQVDSATAVDTGFEVVTELDGVGYGGTDGVYCSDFDGYIRYKISSARALSFSAAVGGVYILDGADSSIKFISRDGTRVELVKKDISEFVYFESFIYSIDSSGVISSQQPITLEEGQLGSGLRIVDGQVLCDIYDSEYNLIRTAVLN